MHRYFPAAAVLLLSLASTAWARPSVVLIYTDDQRADTVAAFGNPAIRTPNLDRLVGRGFSFRRAYCQGSNNGAVCVPSRAMLLTGRDLFSVSEKLDQGEPLMPRVFSDAGYRTFFTGKWHNGYGADAMRACRRAFDNGAAIYLGGMGNHRTLPLRDLRDGEFTPPEVTDTYSTERFADAAVDFLSDAAGSDEPFFLYVAVTAPHDPRQPPEQTRDYYESHRPPLPANFLPQHPFDNGALVLRDENLLAWPRDPDQVRDQLAAYYAMIEHLDTHVGRIVDAAEAASDEVIIVFAADHGLALGSHGLLGKQSVYEHSMRSPVIVTGPGIVSGESDALVYLFDLFPTLADLTGVPLPAGVDGRSLAAALQGEPPPQRDALLLAYKDVQRAVVEDRYKLIRFPKIDKTVVFDLQTDPHETRDISDQQPELTARLLSRLRQLQAEYGDPVPLEVTDPRPAFRDLTGTPRKADQWQPDWIVKKYFDTTERQAVGKKPNGRLTEKP